MATDKDATKKTQVVTLRMPRDVYEGLRALSFATGTSINELVLRAVANHMAQEGHRELVEAAATRVREQYRVALDKLADL
ncbi:MAG: DNA-binding protein [Actinomycetota bacterium]